MAKPELISETPITMVELKEGLAKIKERDGELNFRANKTEEYLNQFVKLSSKKLKELKDKLAALKITRFKEEHITKLTDLLPKTPAEVKVILQGYTLSVSNENAKKIADIIKECA